MSAPNVTASQSMRMRLGEQLRHNKLAILLSILFVILVNQVTKAFDPPLTVAGIGLGNPLALLALWGLLWLKQSGWSDLGLKRPASWRKTIALGVGVAVLVQASAFVVFPLLELLGAGTPDYTQYEAAKISVLDLLGFIGIATIHAGLLEEIIWRGFVMTSIAHLFDNRRTGWVIGLILSSIGFGLIHFTQGIGGMIAIMVPGFAYGLLFLASGRNLWPCIIAHGTTGTIGFLLLFFLS